MGSPPKRDEEFVDFFETHYPTAYRYARALCGDASEAEELTQHAFVRIYARWSKVRTATANAYLRTTLTRLFLDSKRRGRAREHPTDRVPETPVESATPIVERQPLQAALLELAPKQRAVLLLRFACDLPIDEVAETLGCSAGTVKSHTSRGLDALRTRYREQHDGERAPEERNAHRWPTTSTDTVSSVPSCAP